MSVIEPMYAIEIANLAKTTGTLPMLRDLHLHVAYGEAYGVIGPGGSGKSLLVHLLLGFLHPDSGTIRVLGHPSPAVARRRVGFLPERAAYHMRFRLREYLLYLGALGSLNGKAARRRADEVLQRVGLTAAAERPLHTLTRGMLQRFGIAQALLEQPALLILDDPLSMLDEQEQQDLLDLLNSLRQQGLTMLICTHYVPGLVQVCDRIGVLADGQIVAEATAQELRSYSSNVRMFVDHLTPTLRQQLRMLSPAITTSDHSITLRPNNHRLQAQVLQLLLNNGVNLLGLRALENPMERFYVDAMRNTTVVRSGQIQPPPPAPTMPTPPPMSPAAPVPPAAPYPPPAPATPPAPAAPTNTPPAPLPAQEQPAPPVPPANHVGTNHIEYPPDGLLNQLLARQQPDTQHPEQPDATTQPDVQSAHPAHPTTRRDP